MKYNKKVPNNINMRLLKKWQWQQNQDMFESASEK